MSELRQFASGGNWDVTHGIYHDEYEKGADGRWRFAAREYRTLRRDGRGDVFPFPGAHSGPVS